MSTTRYGAATLAVALFLGGCVSDGDPDAADQDASQEPTDEAAEGEPLEDPPSVDGQPLSAEAVTDDLAALLDTDLDDGEVCDALGLDEAELRELSRSEEGDADLAEEAPMDDDVFDDFIGCTAPTSVDVDGQPMTMPGVGVDLYRFDPTPGDLDVDGEVATTPAGRTARLSGFDYDPEMPEAGSAVTWTIYSLEQGVAVRVSGHERSQGTTTEGLGGLFDEVLDRFA